MNNNLKIYNAVRDVPHEAQKKIAGGRLKGFTDINPMWRIKTLTEQFGVAGFGWYTEVVKQWLEEGSGGEVAAFCHLRLFVKINDQWSAPIEGIGGSLFVAKESSGLRADDEAFKKAYTDALGIACKSLGVGADVWWATDRTKPAAPVCSMERKEQKEIPRREEKQQPNDSGLDLAIALHDMNNAPTLAESKRVWSQWPTFQTNEEFIKAKNDRKKYFETH